MASSSTDGEQLLDLGYRFSVLQALGEYSERQRLGPGDRVLPGIAICERSGQVSYISNPAPVVFLLYFDGEMFHAHE